MRGRRVCDVYWVEISRGAVARRRVCVDELGGFFFQGIWEQWSEGGGDWLD